MSYDSITTKEYFPIWKKYRPVILKLMIDSEGGNAQQYRFSKHEFTDVDTKKNVTHPFKMDVFQGRGSYPKRASNIATDLLAVLKQSQRAWELMNEATYHFELDKDYMFHVNSSPAPVVDEPANEPAMDTEIESSDEVILNEASSPDSEDSPESADDAPADENSEEQKED